MPDQRSVMKEFRSLERKRATEGLSPDEEARLGELRELMGPESGAGSVGGGFDVGAAAARLRESLLPAGARSRSAPAPEPEAAPELAPERSGAEGLASAYAPDPFASFDPGASADALLDPMLEPGAPPAEGGALEAAWDPNAPLDPSAAYDPGAQAYADGAQGEDASSGWQPPEAFAPRDDVPQQPYASEQSAEAAGPEMAPPWDPAQPFDPNAPPPWDANAVDPSAGDAQDPNAAPAWDPAQPFDPNAPPAWDPAQPFDPNAQPAWDANAVDPNTAYDPNQPAYDPSQPAYDQDAAAYDPNAAPAWDPNAAPAWSPDAPFDANGAPAWDANAGDPNTPYGDDPNAAPAYDLDAPAEGDPAIAPGGDPALDALATDEAAAAAALDDATAWDPFPAAAGPTPPDADVPLGEPEPGGVIAPFQGDPDALAPEGWDLAAPLPDAAPADAPLGEYDETGSTLPLGENAGLESTLPLAEDAGLESMLPLDPGAEPAAATPSGPAPLGEYDDTAGFSGAAFPDVAPADLPVEHGGFEAARAVAPETSEGWNPEPAVDDGFLLESGGSFDAAAAAAAPEWAIGGGATPWESAAAPDAGAPAAPAAEEGAAPGDVQAPAGAEPTFAQLDAIEPQPEPGAAAAPPAAAGADVDLPSFDIDVDLDLVDEGAFTAEAAETAPGPAPAPAAAEVAPAQGHLAADADAPPPDLSGPAPALDFSRPDLSEGQPEDDFATAPAAHSPPPEEDLPTIDGEEILDESPPEGGAPAQPLDFEPLVVAPPTPARELAAPPPVPPPPPVAAAAPAAPPVPMAPPGPAPERVVEGSHRVVVHTVEGQVRRGVLEDADLAAASLGLAPQAGAAPELVGTDKVKAIFFMLAPGETPPAPDGKKVRVTFRDGRQIAGFSPDYDETGPGFFMVPGDTRTNTGRIWVYRASVKQVAVS